MELNICNHIQLGWSIQENGPITAAMKSELPEDAAVLNEFQV